MRQVIETFNQYAVQLQLSANAILFWQRLYFIMERKDQWENVQIDTITLTNLLQISRQGLLHVRRTLVEAVFWQYGRMKVKKIGTLCCYMARRWRS